MPRLISPLKELRVLKHQIPAHGMTPNTSIQSKPLLIYKSAFSTAASANDIEEHLSSVGVVTPQWRYTMFSTSHFHVCSVKTHATSSNLNDQKFSDPSPKDNLPRTPGHLPRLSKAVLRARRQPSARGRDAQQRRCGHRSRGRCASVDGGFGGRV